MKHLTAMLKSRRALFLCLALIAPALGAQAQNQIDATFNAVPSATPDAKGQVVQADGKVIVWANVITVDGQAPDQLARLNVDGSLDPSFSYCACHYPSLVDVSIQSDGRVLVSGRPGGTSEKVIRVNTDGSLDASFNTVFEFGATGDTGIIDILAIQSDGKILIQHTRSSPFSTQREIVRLNVDGSADGSFSWIIFGSSPSGGTEVTNAVILPDGKIALALTSMSTGDSSTELRRYISNGSLDPSWEQPAFSQGGAARFANIDGVDAQPDGSLIVTGRFDSVNGAAKVSFVRLLTGGNVDMAFTASGLVLGRQVQVLSSGKILVSAQTAAAAPRKIYRLNPDGSTDGSFAFDPSVSNILSGWSLDPAGRIVFFGTSSAGVRRYYRLNVNGDMEAAFVPNVGTVGEINTMVAQSDGKFVVAGNFIRMNGVARPTLARLNSDGTLDGSFDPGTGFSSAPWSIVLQADGKILAAGSFTTYNGVSRPRLARIESNGSLDLSFTPTFSAEANSIALQSDGKIVVVGGFATVNGVSRTGIARLNADGTLDPAFAPVVAGSAYLKAIAIQPDGKILVSGTFTGINGFNRSNLARLNSDGSLDQSFNAGTVTSSWNVWVQPDGKVLFGDSTLFRRNVDGSVDAGFQSPVLQMTTASGSPEINSVLIQGDGSIILGGLFSSVNTVSRRNIARLSASGDLDLLFFPAGSNTVGDVNTLLAQAGGKVLIGGSFTRFNNAIRAALVRVQTVAFRRPTAFDFDGDGRSDISVTRPAAVYTWYQLLGSNYTFSQVNFGQAGDVVTPADFDGDGRTDPAIFRPSNGQWWYLSSLDGSQRADTLGASGDIPLASDYSGNGKADFVLYRPSTGEWLRRETTGQTSNIVFGAQGDKPLVGDFDGDGKSDPAVFRPSTGVFWYAASSLSNAHRAVTWGVSTDIPAVADYDGDGKTDVAVYRPSNGVWWVLNSGNGSYTALTWGIAEDKPIPADYDGDGRADIAVFRPSTGTWYLLTSASGFSGFQWGVSTDIPSPGSFVP